MAEREGLILEIDLPAIPAGVITLLGILSPYAIAFVNSPKWSTGGKRAAAIVVAILMAGVALGGYYIITDEPVLNWPMLVILFVLVSQASYALVTKKSADYVESHAGVR